MVNVVHTTNDTYVTIDCLLQITYAVNLTAVYASVTMYMYRAWLWAWYIITLSVDGGMDANYHKYN